MKVQDIIVALNGNLGKEYASVLIYMQFSGDPRVSRESRIVRMFSHLAEDEMRHAEKLAKTIAEIGGEPSWQVAPFERMATLKESLELIVKLETEAVKEYSSLIEKLSDRPTIRMMLESMLEDEKIHKAQTERLLGGNLPLLSMM